MVPKGRIHTKCSLTLGKHNFEQHGRAQSVWEQVLTALFCPLIADTHKCCCADGGHIDEAEREAWTERLLRLLCSEPPTGAPAAADAEEGLRCYESRFQQEQLRSCILYEYAHKLGIHGVDP